MIKLRYAVLAALLFLVDCEADVIHLRNEQTGERATCGGRYVEVPGRSADAALEHCLKVFRQAGFKEVPQDARP